MGGNRPRLLEGQRAWLVARLTDVPDMTLRALMAELHARGVQASYVSVWRAVRRAGFSFKKNTIRRRAGST
jgi:putative transposase